jgi:hypothetical protein
MGEMLSEPCVELLGKIASWTSQERVYTLNFLDVGKSIVIYVSDENGRSNSKLSPFPFPQSTPFPAES